MADDSDTVSLELTTRHAIALAFVVGVFAGGFTVSTVSGLTSPTGAVTANDQPTDTGTQPSGDTGAGTQQNNRVSLTTDMLEGEPTLGEASAPVTIVEYSDFGCPWCAEWAGVDAIPQRRIDSEDSLDKVVSEYVESGKVRFVFKDYPVSQLHPNAPDAHQAANCVLEQGEDLYWKFHDALFERRSEWTAGGEGNTQATFDSIAENIGADVSAMNACIDSSDGSESSEDKTGIHQASGRLGTPTFFIGSVEDGFRKVQGAQPYSSLKPLIESELSG